jgi:hypothetical protein
MKFIAYIFVVFKWNFTRRAMFVIHGISTHLLRSDLSGNNLPAGNRCGHDVLIIG